MGDSYRVAGGDREGGVGRWLFGSLCAAALDGRTPLQIKPYNTISINGTASVGMHVVRGGDRDRTPLLLQQLPDIAHCKRLGHTQTPVSWCTVLRISTDIVLQSLILSSRGPAVTSWSSSTQRCVMNRCCAAGAACKVLCSLTDYHLRMPAGPCHDSPSV